MKELALVCWIAAVGFAAGIFADQKCFRSPAEQKAIEASNAAGRECLRLRVELDALRREQMHPTSPDGERIPAVNPPLPTE